jgi:hypothetical protein
MNIYMNMETDNDRWMPYMDIDGDRHRDRDREMERKKKMNGNTKRTGYCARQEERAC